MPTSLLLVNSVLFSSTARSCAQSSSPVETHPVEILLISAFIHVHTRTKIWHTQYFLWISFWYCDVLFGNTKQRRCTLLLYLKDYIFSHHDFHFFGDMESFVVHLSWSTWVVWNIFMFLGTHISRLMQETDRVFLYREYDTQYKAHDFPAPPLSHHAPIFLSTQLLWCSIVFEILLSYM